MVTVREGKRYVTAEYEVVGPMEMRKIVGQQGFSAQGCSRIWDINGERMSKLYPYLIAELPGNGKDWIGWSGGKEPPEGEVAEVLLRYGRNLECGLEFSWEWNHDSRRKDGDIIAYLPAAQPKPKQPDGPIRTVEHRELVPGAYGAVKVLEDGGVMVPGIIYAPDYLESAAMVLSQIAEYQRERGV